MKEEDHLLKIFADCVAGIALLARECNDQRSLILKLTERLRELQAAEKKTEAADT